MIEMYMHVERTFANKKPSIATRARWLVDFRNWCCPWESETWAQRTSRWYSLVSERERDQTRYARVFIAFIISLVGAVWCQRPDHGLSVSTTPSGSIGQCSESVLRKAKSSFHARSTSSSQSSGWSKWIILADQDKIFLVTMISFRVYYSILWHWDFDHCCFFSCFEFCKLIEKILLLVFSFSGYRLLFYCLASDIK